MSPLLYQVTSKKYRPLTMEYGTVPIVHASAGVKRIIGLSYVLIWAWFRHQRNARLAGLDPFDQMILVVDEIEAHLHPRWQRAIVPALMEVIDVLSDDLVVQAHIATHSPLILASAETIFEKDTDALHHLELDEGMVSVSKLDFGNFGSVDAWLMSEVFGLRHARSIEAERWIERAKYVQLVSDPDPKEVYEVDQALRRCIRDDDEFWPRWRYFAQRSHGKRRWQCAMIFVQEQPEPVQFDERVRIPGPLTCSKFPIQRRRNGGRDPIGIEFWESYTMRMMEYVHTRATGSLQSTGADTVDHFVPKSVRPTLAYEWSNYRLVCARMNGRKGDKQDVLDPFSLREYTFALGFPSLLVLPSKDCSDELASQVEKTVERLRLNEELCIKARWIYVRDYCKSWISFDFLAQQAPFISSGNSQTRLD